MWKAFQFSPLTQLCQKGYFESCVSKISWPFPPTLSPPSPLILHPPSPPPHHQYHHQYLSTVNIYFSQYLNSRRQSCLQSPSWHRRSRAGSVRESTGLGSSLALGLVEMICRTECSKCISACKAEIATSLPFYLFISLSSRLFNIRSSFFLYFFRFDNYWISSGPRMISNYKWCPWLMQRLRKTPQYTPAKEQILPKRQKEALLSADQEPSLAWTQIKESCEPLVSISAGCCPECLIFVPKNSMSDLFTEEFSRRCLCCAQQLPLLPLLGIPGVSGWFMDFNCSLQPSCLRDRGCSSTARSHEATAATDGHSSCPGWNTLPKWGQTRMLVQGWIGEEYHKDICP